MPLIQTDSQHYSDIADAIRDMSGNEAMFYPSEMAAGVRSIPQTIAIAPIIYSLEEREVGVWTDGKPLYQITLVWHNTELNQWVLHDISELNMDSLCYIEGYVNRVTSENSVLIHPLQYRELGRQDTYAASCRLRNDNTASRIDIYNALPSGNSSNLQIVTIQYTKTTDNPGTGKWTTRGVPAHHYSTEEQVIGTWINGKPLYERTYDFTINDLHNGDVSSSLIRGEFQLPSLDAISYDQIWIEQSYLTDKKPVGTNSVISNSLVYASNGSYIRTNLQYNTYTFIFLDMTYSVSNFYTDRNNLHFVFVIRYTKTTD